MATVHRNGFQVPPGATPSHLSSDEALNGVGEHDDAGIKEASEVGHGVLDAVVVEEVSLGHLQEGEEPRETQDQTEHEADGDRGVSDFGKAS